MVDNQISRNTNTRQYSFNLSLFATALAFVVIVLGAYTRLTDAGLGCPDWPGCYGEIIPHSTIGANQPINMTKAWTEMIHRYLAGSLSLVIFVLSLLAIRNRHSPRQPVLLPLILVALVIFQALLGMWTVTFKLFPLVVMAHLLGGLATLSLLGWITLALKPTPKNFITTQVTPLSLWERMPKGRVRTLKILAVISLVALIAQLFLGGWTSANYAALVCLDFPFCNLNQSFDLNFSTAFNLTSAGVTGSIGEPLDNTARITIHMLHRIGALLVMLVTGSLALLTFLSTQVLLVRILSIVIASFLILQVLLGILNVLALLPLFIAVAHNAVAALLLLTLIGLNYYLYEHVKS